jgi:hypothetical protein
MKPNADEFCSAWQHDYVDERYNIQAVMQPLLKRFLDIDDAVLRRVPKTKMVFRRSQGMAKFRKQQGGMSMMRALQESIPVVAQIVSRVSPKVVSRNVRYGNWGWHLWRCIGATEPDADRGELEGGVGEPKFKLKRRPSAVVVPRPTSDICSSC